MRFELTPTMINDLKQGAALSVGIDHPKYQYAIEAIPASIRESLVADLD
jgi:hypothetical protein